MTIHYTNQNGESLTLRQRRPYFLQRLDGTGNVRKVVDVTVHSNELPVSDTEEKAERLSSPPTLWLRSF